MAVDLVAERAFWEARGQAAEFDAAVGTAPPAAQQPAQTPAPSPADQLKGFMPPNVAEAARAAVAAGHWTPEQAKAQLEGYDPAAIDAALAGVQVETNPDMVTLNKGGFVGAQSAAEIGPVGYDPSTISHLTPEQFMQLDGNLKQAAIDMGVPAAGAAPLIKTIADAAAKIQAMSEPERRTWAETQKVQMVSALGVEAAKDMHAKAAAAFAKIANLDLAEHLVRTGVLDDQMVVWTLAQSTNVAAVREAVRGGQSLASIANKTQGA